MCYGRELTTFAADRLRDNLYIDVYDSMTSLNLLHTIIHYKCMQGIRLG